MTEHRELTTLDAERSLPAIRPEVGQAANEAAAHSSFADYRSRRAANTLKRQDRALTLFADYLRESNAGDGPTGEALATDPDAWRNVTWGLVEGLKRWLLLRGYATGSINTILSTVKTYATLTARAGALTTQDLALIRTVQGYSRREGLRVDEKREAGGFPTRCGHKKREPVTLTADQVTTLKAQPDTPQGRRDAVLLGLLCDLGLRCGEVAGLTVGDVDLKRGELRFYRAKVNLVQTHRLPIGLRAAMAAYLEQDAPPIGSLLRSSHKSGELTHAGMSERAITARVRYLGEHLLDIEGLSAHDLRHTWATQAARAGTPLDRLQQAGGWTSLAMPARYIERAKIANEGVRLA